MRTMAGGLQLLGVRRGDTVSMFSENSSRWLITDGGLMMAGGINAVRGGGAAVEELQYIYRHSESMAAVVETPALMKKLLDHGGITGADSQAAAATPPRFILILHPGERSGDELRKELGIDNLVTYDECMRQGEDGRKFQPLSPALTPDDAATMLYTSGTTGFPKGVQLQHKSLMHQVVKNSFNRVGDREADPYVGDVLVSILPCWHIFERSAEYFFLARGVQMVYSNVRTFKNDLKKYRPHFLVAVPRLYETIYKGVESQFASQPLTKRALVKFFRWASGAHMKATRVRTGMVIRREAQGPSSAEKLLATAVSAGVGPLAAAAEKLVWSKVREGLGGRIKVLVSGGSLLPGFLEDFFQMIGNTVIVGYGLTETSPVISSRLVEHNLVGSVGIPPPETSLKLVDVETRVEVPLGEVGVVWAKGPQVMSGYRSDPAATASVMDKDGYFCTGDLGRINPSTGDLILTGRAKDTIVLSNGENVEPEPLEDLICSSSPLVDQVMVLGQDKKHLGAVVVVNPFALGEAGLLPSDVAASFSKIVGGSPLTLGCAGTKEELKQADKLLRKKTEVAAAVIDEMRKAVVAKGRPPWEVVQAAYITLEPFCVPNGLLTQTLKVKRAAVMERYADKLNDLYK
jgi:long-chain acyl-CoA synthetase